MLSQKAFTVECNFKELKVTTKQLESKVFSYTLGMRDLEQKLKIGKARYETLTISSNIVIKKIASISVKLART